MMITVTDLFDGVTPETSPITITVIEGSATAGGGGGAVDSVNGEVGVVVLDATDVGADAAGAAAAAQAASQPVDSDLTAIAALSTTAFGRALLALADAAAGRTALSLGTAAVAATGDFDAAGAAAAAQAASQPLDSDLTAIAALTTTSYGRAFLALADAAAARSALSLGTAALISSTAGGDLSGTLPSPTVAKINGVAVTGTPSAGYVPTATSSSAATWQAASTGGSTDPHPFIFQG